MAGVTLAQACGIRRCPDPVADLPTRQSEDKGVHVQQLRRGPDGQQGLGGFPADEQYHSFGLLVRLGPAQVISAAPSLRNSTSPQVSAAASDRRSSPSLRVANRARSTRALQEARSADSNPFPRPPKGRLMPAVAFTAARASAVSGRACFWGLPVGPGDALHDLAHRLVVGGIGVASGLVDGGQGRFVEPDGGHREAALLGQVGQVGCHQGRGGREGQGARAWAQASKLFHAELYMARVLSETLESRERRSRARSALVRPVAVAGDGALVSSTGTGRRGFCWDILDTSGVPIRSIIGTPDHSLARG